MDGRLRNMSSIYISQGNKMLLLYRQGSKVDNDLFGLVQQVDILKNMNLMMLGLVS
jgi:hypothetical protein